MGNEQSTQAGAEQEEPDTVENKKSSDEDAPEIGRVAVVKKELAPNLLSPILLSRSAPKSPTATNLREEKKQRKAKTAETVEEDESSSDEEDVVQSYSATATTSKQHTLVEIAGELDEEDNDNDNDNGDAPQNSIEQYNSPASDLQDLKLTIEEQDGTSEQDTTVTEPLVSARKAEGRTSQRSVKRHGQVRLNRALQCLVCAKTLSRADKLKTHQLLHSKDEIEEAVKRDQKLRVSDIEEEIRGDDISQRNSERSESFQDQSHSAKSLQEIPDSAQIVPTPSDAIVNDDEAQSSTKISTSSASLFDEPVDADIVEETPRPKFRLKRKRNMLSEGQRAMLPAYNPHKRRRKHSLSPPTSVVLSDEDMDVQTQQSRSNVLSSSVPKISKPKSAKLGSLDNFAKPWTPGSQLHHPIHNPRSPRTNSSQRMQIVIPQSSHAESSARTATKRQAVFSGLNSDQLGDDQTPLARKGQKAAYTSPKGKRRAEDDIEYSSPLKTATTVGDSGPLEPRGMATSVARRGNTGQDNRKKPKKEIDDAKIKADEGRKGQFSIGEVRKLKRWQDRFCEEYEINIPTFNQMMTDSCRRRKSDPWPYRFISRNDFLQEYYDTLPDRNRRSMHRYRERVFQNVPDKQEWNKEDDRELIRLVKELGQKWVEIGQLMTRTQDSVSQRWRFKLQYQGEVNQGEWLKSEEEKLKAAVAQVKQELGLPQDPTADVRIQWDSVSKKLNGKRTAQQCSNKWRLMHYKRLGNKFVKPSEAEDTPPDPTNTTTTPSRISQRLSGQTPSSLKSGSAQKRKHMSDERVHDSDDEESTHGEQTEPGTENSDLELQDEARSPSRKALAKTSLRKAKDVDTKTKTPIARRSGPTSQTPQAGMGLSEAFNQTQANTSALRAPDSTRNPHTQTEMPTPGIPIQHRPLSSSSWRAINRSDSQTDDSDDGSDLGIVRSSAAQESENAILAEPQTSDSSEETSTEDDKTEAIPETESEDESSSMRSDSPARSESEDSARSTSDESEHEASEQQSSKDKFVRSLARQKALASPISKANLPVGRGSGRTLLADALARKGPQTDSEGDSEDEGDINHH